LLVHAVDDDYVSQARLPDNNGPHGRQVTTQTFFVQLDVFILHLIQQLHGKCLGMASSMTQPI